MARTSISVAATPDAVYDVLADGSQYARWVAGAKRIRSVEGDWPAPGSRFHHTVGVGLLCIRDHTEVVTSDRPRRLVLKARVRPAGEARVELLLKPEAGGTKVTMDERPSAGPARQLRNRLLDAVIHLRNVESLRRLKRRVEQGA